MSENSDNVGKIGESVVARYLLTGGYSILSRNYRKKWGEIDIIAQKNNIIHFIEVKTVSRENIDFVANDWAPEENVHPQKLKRIVRAIQSYIMEKDFSEDEVWQIDVVGVLLNLDEKKARIRVTENVVI